MPLCFRFFISLRQVALVVLVGMLVDGAAAQEAISEEEGPIYVDFQYDAPAACMKEERAFSLVHRRSRRVVRAEQAPASQFLHMQIGPGGDGYQGVLTVRRADGAEERRTMTGAKCSEVVEALALTAALSIDPRATLTLGSDEAVEEQKPSSEIPPPDEERIARDRSGPEESERAEAPKASWAIGALLSTRRAMDHTMHVGGGVDLAFSDGSRRVLLPVELRVGLRGLLEPTRLQPAIRTNFLLAEFAYCPLRLGSSQALLLCPVIHGGMIFARPVGFEDETRVARSYFGAGLEAWLRANIAQRGQLWVLPRLLIPFTHRDFAVDPGPEVLVATLDFGWSVSTGVALRF